MHMLSASVKKINMLQRYDTLASKKATSSLWPVSRASIVRVGGRAWCFLVTKEIQVAAQFWPAPSRQ